MHKGTCVQLLDGDRGRGAPSSRHRRAPSFSQHLPLNELFSLQLLLGFPHGGYDALEACSFLQSSPRLVIKRAVSRMDAAGHKHKYRRGDSALFAVIFQAPSPSPLKWRLRPENPFDDGCAGRVSTNRCLAGRVCPCERSFSFPSWLLTPSPKRGLAVVSQRNHARTRAP